ncbi:MAG: amino acid--tRNA ligase-related protein [Pseudomonadota bacterium]
MVIRDFPPGQAALAKLNESGWADRFELYLNGKEVANAYQELNDSGEQRHRFEEFQKQRVDEVPIDEDFMRHLESGMPPAAGIAVGLERLYMSLFNLENIEGLFEFGFD